MKRFALYVLASLALVSLPLQQVRAQAAYPAKAVRIVVPFPPGQATEIMARLIAQHLSEKYRKQFYVENRPGAGGIIGVETAARAEADGYTLLVTASGTLAVNPHIYKKLNYDPQKDFEPISLLGIVPLVVVVHPSLGVKSVEELIALARKKPGSISYASSGIGTAQHLAMELFKSMAKIDLVHIPYKGSSPAVSDLLTGRVPAMFNTVASALPNITNGQVRALAVSTTKRSSALPDVPTMHEAGVQDFQAPGWAGMLAPKGTPKGIVSQLNSDVVNILSDQAVAKRVLELGMEPSPTSTEEFAKFIQSEIKRWGAAVRAAGVTPN